MEVDHLCGYLEGKRILFKFKLLLHCFTCINHWKNLFLYFSKSISQEDNLDQFISRQLLEEENYIKEEKFTHFNKYISSQNGFSEIHYCVS